MNTKMVFMYRDADNYKSFSEVVLAGTMTNDDYEAIKGNLDEGEFFIPHQLGLPAPADQMVGLDGFPNPDLDHSKTTFPLVDDVKEFETKDQPTHDISICDFVTKMTTEEWDIEAEWERYQNL